MMMTVLKRNIIGLPLKYAFFVTILLTKNRVSSVNCQSTRGMLNAMMHHISAFLLQSCRISQRDHHEEYQYDDY